MVIIIKFVVCFMLQCSKNTNVCEGWILLTSPPRWPRTGLYLEASALQLYAAKGEEDDRSN